MITQTDVHILKMLALGFSEQEVATTLKLELKEYASAVTSLMKKANCANEITLGVWWYYNKKKYTRKFLNNLPNFDFTKITSISTRV